MPPPRRERANPPAEPNANPEMKATLRN
jgi:hypothetical protein